jgi:5-methyltetrahydrofolate--homocysteine methyltransferase
MDSIIDVVRTGDSAGLQKLVKKQLEEGVRAKQIMDDLSKGMITVGDCFESGEAFLPDMILAAEALKSVIPILEPYLLEQEKEIKVLGKVVIATIEGDVHDIGKNLVSYMLETSGFAVVDLGVDVSAQEIIQRVKQEEPHILALSTLLSTGVVQMRKTIASLVENDLRKSLKIIIGGAPIDSNVVEEVQADGYGQDAIDAVKISKSILGL